jgi:hypothetical protein
MQSLELTGVSASVFDLKVSRDSCLVKRFPEVPAISLSKQQVELIRRSGLLGRRLRDEQPLLLAVGKGEGAVRILEDVALLEHLVDLLLHAAELVQVLLSCSSLLLHLVKAAHLLGDLSLLLLLLELLILDLDTGLAALGGSLHEVARFALRDCMKHER